MTPIDEKKISAEVWLIHAEQMSLYNSIVLRIKQWTQMKTKQLKQDIWNNISNQLVFLNCFVFETTIKSPGAPG